MKPLLPRPDNPRRPGALQQTAGDLRSGEVVYRLRLEPDRRYEYLGPAAETILGRPPEAFYADPDLALDLVAEEDRGVLTSLFADPSERAGDIFLRWRHGDGTVVWTEVLRVPIRDELGRVVAVEGVLRDVTREKTLESERDRHAALLQALIANLQDGVIAESEDGRITVVNDAYCRMFDLPDPSEVLGRRADDVREALWGSLADVSALNREMTVELRRERRPQLGCELRLADGRVLDCDYVPVVDRAGTITHMWHYRDVTRRTDLEERLRESKRRLGAF
jgi:PAS domain S-box-containing protein